MTDRARPRLDERRPPGRRSWAFDGALALFATGLELASVTGARGTASVPVIVLAVVGGALLLRRSAPLAVLATTLAAGAAIVAVGGEPTGLTAGIGLYTTAAMCALRVSLAALVPTAATPYEATLPRNSGRAVTHPTPRELRAHSIKSGDLP